MLVCECVYCFPYPSADAPRGRHAVVCDIGRRPVRAQRIGSSRRFFASRAARSDAGRRCNGRRALNLVLSAPTLSAHSSPQSGAPAAELRSLRTAATGLKGYNVFCLDVRVSWPLTLILSPAAMLRYQLLFRHLFFCRYVERSVGGAWVAHQACKELELRATLALSFTLRQKMLHFLRT